MDSDDSVVQMNIFSNDQKIKIALSLSQIIA